MTIEKITHHVIREHPEVVREYAEECSNCGLTYDPQWGTYDRMEKLGMMQAFGVMDKGKMIGLSIVLNTVLPHYGVKCATVESLFVGKKYENTSAGGRLMITVSRYAKLIECVKIFYTAPVGGRLEKILAKRYPRTNAVFCQSIA